MTDLINLIIIAIDLIKMFHVIKFIAFEKHIAFILYENQTFFKNKIFSIDKKTSLIPNMLFILHNEQTFKHNKYTKHVFFAILDYKTYRYVPHVHLEYEALYPWL